MKEEEGEGLNKTSLLPIVNAEQISDLNINKSKKKVLVTYVSIKLTSVKICNQFQLQMHPGSRPKIPGLFSIRISMKTNFYE